VPLDHPAAPESNFAASRRSVRPGSLGERLAQTVTRWTGSTAAFSVAMVSVVVYFFSGGRVAEIVGGCSGGAPE
jgi:hypothetical protein